MVKEFIFLAATNIYVKMVIKCTKKMSFFVFWASTVTIIVHGFTTTLDGPFKPETAPLDPNLNPIAFDLPDSDPSFVEPNSKFQPQQISVSLSYSFDSVWISWVTVTGLFDSLTFLFLYFFPVNLDIY